MQSGRPGQLVGPYRRGNDQVLVALLVAHEEAVAPAAQDLEHVVDGLVPALEDLAVLAREVRVRVEELVEDALSLIALPLEDEPIREIDQRVPFERAKSPGPELLLERDPHLPLVNEGDEPLLETCCAIDG